MRDTLEALLAELLSDGTAKPAHGTFAALRIRRFPNHLLAITDEGAPCVLVHAKPLVAAPIPPLRLQGLEVHYNLPCRVALPNGEAQDRTLTTLVCTAMTPAERSYFLHAAEIVLRIVGPEPDLSAVRTGAEQLANLFQRLARPARASLTGILGELTFISRSASLRHAVMAWRSSVDDRYDFADADIRIEVKATQERARAHYLSFEQCDPPSGTIGILVSIFIESSGGGLSLGELIASIEAALIGHHAAILRLHEVLADTLGQSLTSAIHERFDMQLATQSLQFFDLREVPAIRAPLPHGVSQVRFRADLSRCMPKAASAFAAASETAGRLLPA